MSSQGQGIDFRTRLLGASQLAREALKGKVSLTELGQAGERAGDRASLGSKGFSIFSSRANKSEKDARKVKSSLSGLIGTLGGLGAAWVGYDGVKSALSTTTSLASETVAFSRATNMSTKASAQWVAVARVHNLQGNGLTKTFGMLSKNIALARKQEEAQTANAKKRSSSTGISLAGIGYGSGYELRRQQVLAKAQLAQRASAAKGAGTQAAAFKKLGITSAELAGAGKNLDPIMLKLSQRFNALPSAVERNALANTIFGHSYTQMLDLFHGGTADLQTNLRWAQMYGVAIGGETPKELKKFLEAQEQAKYASLGLQTALGVDLYPAMLKVLQDWPKLVTAIQKGTGPFGTIKAIIAGVASATKGVVGWFGQSKTATMLLVGSLAFLGTAWGVEKVISFTTALKKLWLVEKLMAATSWLSGAKEAEGVAGAMGMGNGATALMGGDKAFSVAGRAAGVAFQAAFLGGMAYLGFEIGKYLGERVHFHFDPGRILKGESPLTVTTTNPVAERKQLAAKKKKQEAWWNSPAPVIQKFQKFESKKKKPGLAAGGIIAHSGRVIVGEKGKEELQLPRSARVIPLPHGQRAELPVIKVILQSVLKGKVISEDTVDDLLSEAARA
jgi:hypothetical protein